MEHLNSPFIELEMIYGIPVTLNTIKVYKVYPAHTVIHGEASINPRLTMVDNLTIKAPYSEISARIMAKKLLFGE